MAKRITPLSPEEIQAMSTAAAPEHKPHLKKTHNPSNSAEIRAAKKAQEKEDKKREIAKAAAKHKAEVALIRKTGVHGPFDWSVEQILEHKATGKPLQRIPDRDVLRKLGASGISMTTAADIFNVSYAEFSNTPEYIDNFKAGRSSVIGRVRTSIVNDALEKDSLNAKIYLDKIWATDNQPDKIEISARNKDFDNIKTSDLIEVMVTALISERKDDKEDDEKVNK